jgi:glycosyltransferase involved in cell wall biosynthesis
MRHEQRPTHAIPDHAPAAMKCSIVVRAYNEAEHLGSLFEGISRQTVREVEIIVVDSGSADASVEIALENGARVVRIPSQEFSFGRSLNLGIQAAESELVVIASAHVRPVYPDWLECLLGPFDDPQVALVYGRQRGDDSSRFSERQIFRQWFPDVDMPSQTHAFCNNANAAVRRTLWQQHAYDEELTGLEDVAWAKWAMGAGQRIAYAAHAEVIHVHTENPRRVYERYRREGMAFKRIFPESHFSAYDFARLTLSNTFTDLRDAWRQAEIWRHLSSIVWFRAMQFWGTYQGYRQSGPVTQALRQTFYYPPGGNEREIRPRAVKPIRYGNREK